jgi:hypothetical protein
MILEIVSEYRLSRPFEGCQGLTTCEEQRHAFVLVSRNVSA